MRLPQVSNSDGGAAAGVGGPAVVVLLVLLIGATAYLRHARYLRRRTTYVLLSLLSIALIYSAVSLYTYGA